MAKTCHCIVCLDSGYLAIHKQNEDDIRPMCEIYGPNFNDYRLRECACKTQADSKWRKQIEGKVPKKTQNWHQERLYK